MNLFKNHFVGMVFFSLLLTIAVMNCGGSSTADEEGDGNETLTATQASRVGSVNSSLAESLSYAPGRANKIFRLALNCGVSGTIDIDADNETITYTDCLFEYDSDGDLTDDTSIYEDGSMDYDYTATTMTITFDLDTIITDLLTSTSESSSIAGTMSENLSTGTSTVDITGTFGSSSFSVDGSMTLTGNDLTEDLCFDIDGIAIRCTATSSSPLDVSTATPADYAAVCSIVSSC